MDDTHDRDLERISAQIERGTVETVAKMAKAFRQADLPQFETWDGKHCFDCDDPLPELRIKDGRVRCVTCQTKVEKRAR